MEHTEDTNMFNLEKSEELTLEDLRLKDRNEKPSTTMPKTYVEKFDTERPPFKTIIKPYLEYFLSGTHTVAGAASTYGQKAFGVVSAAFWWGVQGIKSLYQKTKEIVQPQFVLLTNKKEPNKQQLDLITKLQRDKEMAVVGINQLNELKPMGRDGKVRVTVPADQQFLNYLKNEKYQVREEKWVEEADPTKTIVMPSMSFVDMVTTLERDGQEVPKKEVFNFGNFCVFEMQGKNEIEYGFIEKLRLSKGHLQGYLLSVQEIKKKDSSNDSKPEHEGLLVNKQSIQLPDTLTPQEIEYLQQKPVVTVKEVPLIEPKQEQSHEMYLA